MNIDCFLFLAIVNNAGVNIHWQRTSLDFSFFGGICPGPELLGYMVILVSCLFFEELPTIFTATWLF